LINIDLLSILTEENNYRGRNMRLFQRSTLFLITLAVSTSLYAVSITSEDQLDDEPDYSVGRQDSRIITVDFAKRGVKLDQFESDLGQQITRFRNSNFAMLTIDFINILTTQHLEHIKSIFTDLKDYYDERIEVGALTYRENAPAAVQNKGQIMLDKFIAACERIKDREEERERRSDERAARAEQRREEFEESQGANSSAWMGDEYFESDDE
jgi:hypothetical protein